MTNDEPEPLVPPPSADPVAPTDVDPGLVINADPVLMTNDDPLRLLIKNLTLLVAFGGYVALAIYLVWKTWDARGTGTAPTIPGVQSAALGGLAVALGAGYASVLGVPVSTAAMASLADKTGWDKMKAWLTSSLTERSLLGLGAVLYLAAGVLICITYGLNESETPTILKTVAVGFAGYVVAYLGAAYQRFTAS